MIPDPKMSSKALMVVAEIILMMHERSEVTRHRVTELVYRGLRVWVLNKAKSVASSDPSAIDKACRFWSWLRQADWLDLYDNSSATSLDEWFEDLVINMLAAGEGDYELH